MAALAGTHPEKVLKKSTSWTPSISLYLVPFWWRWLMSIRTGGPSASGVRGIGSVATENRNRRRTLACDLHRRERVAY